MGAFDLIIFFFLYQFTLKSDVKCLFMVHHYNRLRAISALPLIYGQFFDLTNEQRFNPILLKQKFNSCSRIVNKFKDFDIFAWYT